MKFLWASLHTFPVPFRSLEVNSTRFPLEEGVCCELLATQILRQEKFSPFFQAWVDLWGLSLYPPKQSVWSIFLADELASHTMITVFS